MASLHASELDSAATDSVASSPRSDHFGSHDTRVRFMCSFGGKILPRPHDNQLRYVGGDTRIVAVHRSTSFSTLLTKLSKLSGIPDVTVKYQLPNEDLDALISVTTDEDVENMIEEFDRVSLNQNPRSARLRLFLFPKGEDSRASSISSLLDGSTNREHWFFDALNSTSGLERGRSEVSSIVSEVPDYLFGLDNSDETREPKIKTRHLLQDNVSASDPGSPAPVVSSPFCSTSSAVPIVHDLPPVKTKVNIPDPITQPMQVSAEATSDPIEQPVTQPIEYSGNNPVIHYIPNPHYPGHPAQQMPVYYMPGSAPPQGTVPGQHVQIRPHQYVQQYPLVSGQIPVGYHPQIQGMGQVYGGSGMRAVSAGLDPYDSGRLVHDGMNQQVYYGVRNAVPGYAGMMMPGGEELQRTSSDAKQGRVSQSS